MGIAVEFCPDLALRAFGSEGREVAECLPEVLKVGEVYEFLKSGQRLYWLSDDEFWSRGELPLCKTSGSQKLSRPLASVKILEVTHFLKNKESWTRGKYKVIEIFNPKNKKIYFEGYKKIK